MSDKLKKFVAEHKQEFDTGEPNKEVWAKIDAKLDLKNGSPISSHWLSKLKYLGFSASILIIAICLFATNFNPGASGEAVEIRINRTGNPPNIIEKPKDQIITSPAEVNSAQKIKAEENNIRTKGNIIRNDGRTEHDTIRIKKEDVEETAYFLNETDIKPDSIIEKNDNAGETAINKKTKLYIPEYPTDVNSYTGTLYAGTSFCALLRVYKFPGKVGLDMGGYKNAENYKIKMTTISCSRLSRIPNMKAVWLKGKTDKKIMFSLKDKFSSIQLVKKDGRKLSPDAVSHYYPGLLVISDYNGKFFNMAFEDKVDMILFFSDAEEGDKIVIDNVIEAIVKGQ